MGITQAVAEGRSQEKSMKTINSSDARFFNRVNANAVIRLGPGGDFVQEFVPLADERLFQVARPSCVELAVETLIAGISPPSA